MADEFPSASLVTMCCRFFDTLGALAKSEYAHEVEVEVQRREEGDVHPDYQSALRRRINPPAGRRSIAPLAAGLDCLPRLSEVELSRLLAHVSGRPTKRSATGSF
jgi:hypothetical protein